VGQQQPIRVVVEKKGGCFCGCGTSLAVLLVVGLAVQYWYVLLGAVVLAVVVGIVRSSQAKKTAHRRPGPRDPWINEVAVALADLGLTETARNTGAQLGGVPLEGDIGLEADRFAVFVNLFADQELARRAELALRPKPDVREAVSQGKSALKTVDRVLYVANGRGGVLDEFRLDEVVRDVSAITLPPPLTVAPATAGKPRACGTRPAMHSAAHGSVTSPDTLEQLRKLGELRASGVLTDAEFEAKKTELLRRI
jgi:hypothetical protein